MTKRNPVPWFEIYVQDMRRAKAFYEEVFRCELAPLENPDPTDPSAIEMWSFPMIEDGPGAAGALVHMEGHTPGRGTVVYFSCEDCAVEAARLASSGGKVMKEKMSIGEFGFAVIAEDSEGNVIGLHSME